MDPSTTARVLRTVATLICVVTIAGCARNRVASVRPAAQRRQAAREFDMIPEPDVEILRALTFLADLGSIAIDQR